MSYAYSSMYYASLGGGGASIQTSPRISSLPILGACVGSWPREAKLGPERPHSAPRDTNAACPGLSSAWTGKETNRSSLTHLTPTAWSASLRPVDRPPSEAKASVGSGRAHLGPPPSPPPPTRHITGPSGGNAGSWQPPPPPPLAQLHPSGPALPVAVWRAVEAVEPPWTTIPKVHCALAIADIVLAASEMHTGKSSLHCKLRALTYKLL